MTSRDFVYWLQGYLEIEDPKSIPQEKVKIIANHLNLVFKHEIDPQTEPDPQKAQELQNIHDGNNNGWNSDSAQVLRC